MFLKISIFISRSHFKNLYLTYVQPKVLRKGPFSLRHGAAGEESNSIAAKQ